MENPYGECSDCGADLEPCWYIEKESRFDPDLNMYVSTGRHRKAVDVLVCPNCMKEECVDNSFDGPWEMDTEDRDL